jgi:hypothetical protein
LQVFLAIADQAVPLHKPTADSSSSDAGSGRPSLVPGPGPQQRAAAGAGAAAADAGDGLVHGAALYWQQFKALFVKRMLSARWGQHNKSSSSHPTLIFMCILNFDCLLGLAARLLLYFALDLAPHSSRLGRSSRMPKLFVPMR